MASFDGTALTIEDSLYLFQKVDRGYFLYIIRHGSTADEVILLPALTTPALIEIISTRQGRITAEQLSVIQGFVRFHGGAVLRSTEIIESIVGSKRYPLPN